MTPITNRDPGDEQPEQDMCTEIYYAFIECVLGWRREWKPMTGITDE